MHLRMAMAAVLPDGKAIARTSILRGMQGLDMACLAQPGPGQLEHVRSDGAVGFVTVQTVLIDRSVFPQERPAFFSVARITILVDRTCGDEVVCHGAVRIVTRAAVHPALAPNSGRPRPRGHVPVPQLLGARQQMAARAHRRLIGRRQEVLRRNRFHDRVTACATDVVRVVWAARPETLGRSGMTRQTGVVFLLDDGRVLASERDPVRPAGTSAAALHM